jgi:hypothetical protein
MDIGIGLPSTIPGIPGRLILDWASAAKQAGFSSLGTLDRVVYANLETVPVLAAAAAVTERIGLTTAILIGPYRGNGALLAKQLATVDAIAGRAGAPRLVAIAYVSLGDDADAHARAYLEDYYSLIGDFAGQIAAGALTSPQKVAGAVAAFTEAGCDELILFPCNPDTAQVALIAQAAGL